MDQRAQHQHPSTASAPDKLDFILASVHDTGTEMKAKTDTLSININLLQEDYKKIKERVAGSEQALQDIRLQQADNTAKLR
ncbi:hypothetical protein NDU88_013101 [Pleurodeles waltl]|uniref:Uncharacterized protein n=1 Tax=Pleurodeles waltl TaxID=8319 RepID=A0AAV7R3G7_PLEWA|nr:hypothetical protein NDU88_013101 [Pleurodeles waltl]